MPRFLRPFFKRTHGAYYYVQLDGRQVRLAADRDEAFRIYYKLMAGRRTPPPAATPGRARSSPRSSTGSSTSARTIAPRPPMRGTGTDSSSS